MLKAIREEFSKLSSKEILFTLSAMLCGLLIGCEYAIIRPVSNSLFIHSYTSKFFPYAWLAVVPINFLFVFLYNRFLPRFGCFRTFLVLALMIAFGNFTCGFFLKESSILPFCFYVWKEVYILLMLQQVWSVIHATIDMKRAKYLYGLIFGVGGLGGVCGSLISGFMAVAVGSENLLFFSLPLYLLLIFFYRELLKHSAIEEKNLLPKEKESSFSALKTIRASSFLLFILLIVIFMQMASTVIDFQFNNLLEKAVPDKDLRTEYSARVFAAINTCTIALQFVGTFLLVHLLGLRMSHFAIPAFLCTNAIGFLIAPVFGMISFSYITIKSFDFSLFGIIKEMLYIPLKTDEKFRAKAFIDVFAYRSAKAFASLLILFLQWTVTQDLLGYLSAGVIALFTLWAWTAMRLLKKHPSQDLLQ